MSGHRTPATLKALVLLLALSTLGFAQETAIDRYLRTSTTPADTVIAATLRQSGEAKAASLSQLLPDAKPNAFANYILETSGEFRETTNTMLLNKLLGSSAGGSGSTSLVSKPLVPAVLGVGVEYGSIVQATNGMVTTLRANLTGVARLVTGMEQMPYCPAVAEDRCDVWARRFRRVSGLMSFEDSRGRQSGGATANLPTPTPVDLFGNKFRMASWGVHYDLTPSNNLDDPRYTKAWQSQLVQLRTNSAAPNLTQAVSDLFQTSAAELVDWTNPAMSALQATKSPEDFRLVLAEQLDLLIRRMRAKDPQFSDKVKATVQAYAVYFGVRDNLVREAMTHKLSAEYINLHPQGEPSRSSLRFVYAHQPAKSQAVITLNVAATRYNAKAAAGQSRLRDVQAAGQVDRKMGEIGEAGPIVLTFGGYYQWMKEDALIQLGPGNVAPGSGIVLPGSAVTLLKTKGSIGIAQAKLTVPLGGGLSLPVSATWANRTELIKEKDVRGQIGLTLDLDNLLH